MSGRIKVGVIGVGHLGQHHARIYATLPEAELVGKLHFYDLHPEKGRAAFQRATLEVMASKGSFKDLENPIQTKAGQVIWVSTSGIPVLDPHGQLVGYHGSDSNKSKEYKSCNHRRETISLRMKHSSAIERNIISFILFEKTIRNSHL